MNYNSSLIKLINQIKFPKKIIILAIFISIIGSVFELLIPLFTKNLIDNFEVLFKNKYFILLFVFIFIFSSILNGLSIFLLSKIGATIKFSLVQKVWNHILKLPVPFFDKNSVGEILSRIIDDTNIINSFIVQTIPRFFPSLITLLGSIIILFLLDWQTTLVALISMPLYIIIIIFLSNIIKRISFQTQFETAKLSGLISHSLSEIKLIKISGAENKESIKTQSSLTNIYNLALKSGLINSFTSPLTNMIMLISMGSVLGYGGYRVATETITSGTLVAIIFYIMQLTSPIENISGIFTGYKRAEGVSVRLYEIMREKKELLSSSTHFQKLNTSDLVFKNVNFSYNKNQKILHNITFTIPKNQTVALVGPSGSGKTTIFNIISRFYEVDDGSVLYNNTSIYNIPLSLWRNNLGYVMQDNGLINGTIKENIIYALNKDISKKELIHYSKLANIHNFIRTLKLEFDTPLGENGINLSGGEVQRIDIARNLIIQPKLLLLDEATSNLDSESENKIQDALNNIHSDQTILIIAHRLSTVLNADKIIFLDEGHITGIGTHNELMNNHKKYKHMIHLQGLEYHE
ncbi:ABC transporter ATP-binding protein/permease [Staphylococcus haemolyticus]|uniref:ABC transporter ATP-binding protein n=1 Tax=Staphylococcus haemolyticus TaxID=1283 RepID=UPI001F0AE0CC|nr:ABC transporter ATP-binding protein [Staphylococcus haemolyticus]MCH4302831.1 ABC transporter ATP-binding protein/permease [Staphylococcus haemolyticus]MCH4309296.1 ABC transporter ATP-binding protein/permease [Staphylococcus haemolyticus]MCH4311651.1 ABC transporter ATP-binding protein/permease [Staphylococcus haemolyticus]MCH4486810.1 ABC transporter ATP-binding protein/permease [Staphylococcus haemolyticus]MCH4500816.1 ABC transporter ATP-binding protein/permease [Staphylococcus haemolyt